MRARTVVGLLRLGTAAVSVGALTHRLLWGLGSQTIAGENFFAYLTVQSNLVLLALLIAGGVIALRRPTDPRWLSIGLALALTWTTTAGIAFALIVWQAELHGIRMYVPWSDIVIHYVLPTVTAAAWAFAPGHRRVPWAVVPISLAFPVIWGVFTLWRGPLIGWYPYYFLDPRQVSGFGEFCLTSGLALVLFAVVAALIVLVSWVSPAPRSRQGKQGLLSAPRRHRGPRTQPRLRRR